jgi:hypothetical protein
MKMIRDLGQSVCNKENDHSWEFEVTEGMAVYGTKRN